MMVNIREMQMNVPLRPIADIFLLQLPREGFYKYQHDIDIEIDIDIDRSHFEPYCQPTDPSQLRIPGCKAA